MLVKPGDTVAAEQGLITLETDKATMDIPSPAAGKITAVKVKTGDRVSTGSVIASLEPADASAAATPRRAVDARPEDDRTVRQPKLAARATGRAAAPAEPRTRRRAGSRRLRRRRDHRRAREARRRVAAEQGLVTLETEKASMDVPVARGRPCARAQGRRRRARSRPAMPLLVLQPSGAAERTAPRLRRRRPRAPAPAASAPKPPPRAGGARAQRRCRPTPTSFGEAHAGPSVRKLARELGVDLGRVRGSGAKGRVTGDDVKAFVKEIMQGGGRCGQRAARRADRGLREVRPRRDRAAVAHPEDLGPAAARELGQRAARHAARRSRHHGARGETLGAQGAGAAARHQADAARVHHSRVRARARRDAAVQVVARARRREPRHQALHAHRFRGRHAATAWSCP